MTRAGHEPSQRLVPRRSVFDLAFHSQQEPLEFPPPPVVPAREDRSIAARFEAFHLAHPEVYAELVRLARQYTATGRRKLGVKMLWEACRWNLTLRSDSGDVYKLNNVLTSRYARLLMAQEPDLAGVFDTRELRSR